MIDWHHVRPISANDFRAALAHLGLTPYAAAPQLGISRSLAYRYAQGVQPVNRTVALLLAALVREHRRERQNRSK